MSSNHNHNDENDEPSTTAYNNNNSMVPQALDAPLLDDYLSKLLLPKLSAVLSNSTQDSKIISNEFQLALLQMVAILWTRGHTPSLQTLQMKLTDLNEGRRQPYTTTNSFNRILWYAVLSVALPTLYDSAKQRWTAYVAQETLRERFEAAASATTSTRPTQTQTQRQLLMQQRRRLAISTLFRVVDTIVPVLRLGCLLSVWRRRPLNNNNHQHLAPTLAMKLLGLHYAATSTTSASTNSVPLLQVYYAHRRWLHDEVTRLLPLVLVPLQSAWSESSDYVQSWFRLLSSPIQRHVLRLRKKLSAPSNEAGHDDSLTRMASRNKRCPVCQSNQSNPIAIPYETDCGHIYCYTCLWTDHVQHQERNCRICHERIQSCRPVQ